MAIAPGTTALLEEPHADDVLEEAEPAEAAFISEVEREGLR